MEYLSIMKTVKRNCILWRSSMIYTLTTNPAIDMNISTKGMERAKVNRTFDTVYTPNGKGVNVTLTLKRKLLTLQISNNGKNYCGDEVRGKGIGLTTIQERAKAVGGLFTTDIQDGSQKFRLEISLSI